VTYERRQLASGRLTAAMDRISSFARTTETEPLLALAQRIETIADDLEASLPTSYLGFEVGAEVEVLVGTTWCRGRVAKQLSPEVFGRLSVGVELHNPPRGYESGGLFFRQVDSSEIRRAA
jgi:hypothetical protein